MSPAVKLAHFLFRSELNDFLPHSSQQVEIPIRFNGDQSVKHLFESLGVPHTEVGRILVDEAQVDSGYLVKHGDRVTIYPLAENGSIPLASEEARFVLDNHLGRLAGYLRMLGFDTHYRNDIQDEELAREAEDGDRLLLTRDRRLLMRKQVRRGYWVRNKEPRQQVQEVVHRFQLANLAAPFQRCIRCNGLLQPVRKEDIYDRLQPLTRLYFEEFRICPDCDQIYWRGSHYEHMQAFLDEWL